MSTKPGLEVNALYPHRRHLSYKVRKRVADAKRQAVKSVEMTAAERAEQDLPSTGKLDCDVAEFTITNRTVNNTCESYRSYRGRFWRSQSRAFSRLAAPMPEPASIGRTERQCLSFKIWKLSGLSTFHRDEKPKPASLTERRAKATFEHAAHCWRELAT